MAITSATVPEASELVGIPDPETFVQLPWDKRVARVFCTCFRNREEKRTIPVRPPDFRLPRQPAHSSMMSSRPSTSMHLRAGTEPEMMWLKKQEDGSIGGGVTKPNCYHIDQFEELRPAFLKVIEYSQAMGLDMIQGDHEDAPGQLELNIMFDDVLRKLRSPDHLSTDLRPGGPRAGAPCLLHVKAVHGRVRLRLPPQSVAMVRRQGRGQQASSQGPARHGRCVSVTAWAAKTTSCRIRRSTR